MALLNNTFYPLVVLYMHTNKLQQMVGRFQIKMSSAIMRRVKFPLGTGGKNPDANIASKSTLFICAHILHVHMIVEATVFGCLVRHTQLAFKHSGKVL